MPAMRAGPNASPKMSTDAAIPAHGASSEKGATIAAEWRDPRTRIEEDQQSGDDESERRHLRRRKALEPELHRDECKTPDDRGQHRKRDTPWVHGGCLGAASFSHGVLHRFPTTLLRKSGCIYAKS
jgi:hypothetical protein